MHELYSMGHGAEGLKPPPPPPNNIVIHTFLREKKKAELEKLASAPSIKTSLRGPCIVLFRLCQFVFFKYLKSKNSRKKYFN